MLQDGDKAIVVDKEEIQRVVSSCNDFAEAEKRSKHLFVIFHRCLFSNSDRLKVTRKHIHNILSLSAIKDP